MNEPHPYRATILPVPEETVQPLWSVMIPTYNCANYLRETLASVLAQDPGLEIMQIEVVDDHSTKDDPEAVVKELAGDRVSFYRQAENVGYIRNFETCLQRSRGQLVHILHGDDSLQFGFYEKIQQIFARYPSIGAAFCRCIFMDENGHWQHISRMEQTESGILNNWLEKTVVEHPIQTPSIVVKRSVYEHLGGFDSRFTCCCEDWEMWVRIAACYPIGYEIEPLALYRLAHEGSLTKNSLRSGAYAQDIRKASEIASSYLFECLPHSTATHLLYKSKEAGTLGILRLGRQMLKAGETKAAINQLREALKGSHSLKVNRHWLFLLLQIIIQQIRAASAL